MKTFWEEEKKLWFWAIFHFLTEISKFVCFKSVKVHLKRDKIIVCLIFNFLFSTILKISVENLDKMDGFNSFPHTKSAVEDWKHEDKNKEHHHKSSIKKNISYFQNVSRSHLLVATDLKTMMIYRILIYSQCFNIFYLRSIKLSESK